MQKMQRSHHSKIHPRQQAILDLAKNEDLEKLKLREIAEKVGITGKYAASQVWSHMNKLKKKGLLSFRRRMPAFQVEQI
jgi:DNA-binding IscR family transcriptional regulator